MTAILQKLEQESERVPEALPEQEHLEETTHAEETLEQKVQKNLSSFETVRRELGSDFQEPVISFADNKFKVNTTCLKAFPDYNFANILVHRPTKILALIPCDESRRDAYPLCYITDGKRHPKETTCKLLFAMMFDFMGWNPAYRYKILGKKVKANGRELLAFDLTRVKVIPRTDDSGERNGSSKDGYFQEDWRDHFGIPFAEHASIVFHRIENTFHRHSWFPLYNNYFVSRTTSNTPEDMRGKALANLATSKYFGTAYTPTSGTTPSTVTLRGVHLIPRATSSGSVSITASDYLFGYADVHANGSYSHSQVNPYDPNRSTTSGGDPIDISWAVEPMYTYDSDGNATANPDAGKPHYLSAIRYIRVYTGLQVITPPFGENSTEITGAYRATDNGTGSAAAPSFTIGGLTIADLISYSDFGVTVSTTTVSSNQQIITITGASNVIYPTTTNVVVSGSSNVFMNGERTTTKSVTLGLAESIIQIINQSGTAEPFITLLIVS